MRTSTSHIVFGRGLDGAGPALQRRGASGFQIGRVLWRHRMLFVATTPGDTSLSLPSSFQSACCPWLFRSWSRFILPPYRPPWGRHHSAHYGRVWSPSTQRHEIGGPERRPRDPPGALLRERERDLERAVRTGGESQGHLPNKQAAAKTPLNQWREWRIG